jgi:CxxC-x17-CxxC domain-containing protein
MGRFDAPRGRDSRSGSKFSRGSSRGSDRGSSRGSDRGGYRGSDRGSSDRGGYRGSGGKNRRDSPMTEVTCASCGTRCEVPFRPTSNKPVYCNDCFGKKGGSSGPNSSADLSSVHEKLDKILDALGVE